jgi:hypothetical protein
MSGCAEQSRCIRILIVLSFHLSRTRAFATVVSCISANTISVFKGITEIVRNYQHISYSHQGASYPGGLWFHLFDRRTFSDIVNHAAKLLLRKTSVRPFAHLIETDEDSLLG